MNRHFVAIVTVFPLLSGSGLGQAPQGPQAPPRDAAPSPQQTGIIRGRVVAAATGQPLHRVRLTLGTASAAPAAGPAAAAAPSAVTDTRGEFELTGVPPGSHSLTATRSGYLPLQYGQRRPREAGRTITVSPGQTVASIDFALHRMGVIAGRITDELGSPYAAVRVEATEVRYLQGQPIAVAAAITTTNDLGEYRLGGLWPGSYQIRASTQETWEADDGKSAFAYGVTYFPSVVGLDRAETMSLAVGQELAGIDMSLVVGRAARISGTVQSASGEPLAGQAVNLSDATRGIGGGRFSTGFAGAARSDRNGRFEFRSLAPGEYLVGSGGSSVAVVVDGADIDGVLLMPRKPSVLTGSIVSDDGSPLPFPASLTRVVIIDAGAASPLEPFIGPAGPQTISSSWTFRHTNMDGRYLFRITGVPPEWMLKNVELGGRDVTDTPLDVPGGGNEMAGLRMILSRASGTVSGAVVSRDGKPAPDSTVVVFADDSRRWGFGTRFVKAARPDNEGRFTVSGLPPGLYRAVARDNIVDGQWENQDFLQRAAADATRLTLTAGIVTTVTLQAVP
jgi:protocatechuate 3,4-dioxygenase beta subunit